MMLPSTGNFKKITCPFFVSESCLRPYCHYRHIKETISNREVEPTEKISKYEDLRELISQAVLKALENTEILQPVSTLDLGCSVTKAVEEALPLNIHQNKALQNQHMSYIPTPISQLKRRLVRYSPVSTNDSNLISKHAVSSAVSPSHKRCKPHCIEDYDCTKNSCNATAEEIKPFVLNTDHCENNDKFLRRVNNNFFYENQASNTQFQYKPEDLHIFQRDNHPETMMQKSKETAKYNQNINNPDSGSTINPKSSEIIETMDIRLFETELDLLNDISIVDFSDTEYFDERSSSNTKDISTKHLSDMPYSAMDQPTFSNTSPETLSEQERGILSKEAECTSLVRNSGYKSKISKENNEISEKCIKLNAKCSVNNYEDNQAGLTELCETNYTKNKNMSDSKKLKTEKKIGKPYKIHQHENKHERYNIKSISRRSTNSESKIRQSEVKKIQIKTNTEETNKAPHSKLSKLKKNTIVHNDIKAVSTEFSNIIDLSNDCFSEVIEISSSDDEIQCLQYFKNDKVESVPTDSKSKQDNTMETSTSILKKRIAHGKTQSKCLHMIQRSNHTSVNPGKVMIGRITQLNHSKCDADSNKLKTDNVPCSIQFLSATDKGKCHVEFQETLFKKTPEVRRTAHIPSDKTIILRVKASEKNSKIPLNIRQSYLGILYKECLQVFPPEIAHENALEKEKEICDKSSIRSIYVNLMSNLIKMLRKEGNSAFITINEISNEKTTKSNLINNMERTIFNSANITDKSLYFEFLAYVIKEEELNINGFPRPHPDNKGRAIIFAPRKYEICKNKYERICSRCSVHYFVDKNGFSLQDEQCNYHWGRPYQKEICGSHEFRYSCCQSDVNSPGCDMATCHVSDNVNPKNLKGFVKTLEKETPPSDGNFGVYALDCEMCYTTTGLELTRVTVVDTRLSIVFESFVKPFNPIIDYNTKFSGITENDMVNVSTNIINVQSALLSFINSKTILIGHSLESDFKALKLIHDKVVDTSIIFPHKLGPPKKRALKNIYREKLNKIIQESESGHDSAEDAKACMELMIHLIKGKNK